MSQKFKQYMEEKFNEFEKDEISKEAKELKEKIGMHLNHNNYPHYFTGKLDSKIVFVHLNPKEDDNDNDEFGGEFRFKDFNDYFDFYDRYGTHRYGNSDIKFKSPFDKKQLLLIKSLDIMPFLNDDTEDIDRNKENYRKNLVMSLDDKLQLELIPFGSNNFKAIPSKKIQYIDQYIINILDLITELDRDYVFFCGAIFTRLLKKYMVSNQKHPFNVKSINNKDVSCNYNNIELNYKGKVIKAGILITFAGIGFQGNLITQYGKKCKELYLSR